MIGAVIKNTGILKTCHPRHPGKNFVTDDGSCQTMKGPWLKFVDTVDFKWPARNGKLAIEPLSIN